MEKRGKYMSSKEKSRFIAESLAEITDTHSRQFIKENKKLLRSLFKKQDTKKYTEVVSNEIAELVHVMSEWEQKSFDELGGLSPKQYYSSLNDFDDMLELIAQIIEKCKGSLPPLLTEAIKNLREKFSDKIVMKLNSIIPNESLKLDTVQKAELKIAELTASEKFVDPMSKLLFRFDKSTDDETVEYIMKVLKSIGKPSIPCLIAVCEKSGHKGIVYANSLKTLADIASENKSEEIYKYLKECFRKSDEKVIEAMALGLYGDGRAVTAIRTYVERNILNMNETKYSMFRDIITRLGGIVSDLDDEYISCHNY